MRQVAVHQAQIHRLLRLDVGVPGVTIVFCGGEARAGVGDHKESWWLGELLERVDKPQRRVPIDRPGPLRRTAARASGPHHDIELRK